MKTNTNTQNQLFNEVGQIVLSQVSKSHRKNSEVRNEKRESKELSSLDIELENL